MAAQVELSVVVPVYGCADCVGALYRRLVDALEEVTDRFELIFVDDRSPDGAWEALLSLAPDDPRVRRFRLARNFGQHAAITAGLSQSRGAWTVVIDCDMQDPPEEIPRLYSIAKSGYDFVLTKRLSRSQPWLRRVAGRAYFRMRNVFLKTDMDTEYATLSILSRKVVDAFLRIGDRDRQYMLILHWLGFDHTVVEIEHSDRHAGRSSYTFSSLMRVAIDGMFFQTTILLRWIVYLGFIVAVIGVGLAVFLTVAYFIARPFPGWTSLAVLILLSTGTILISTGVTGLYIGKIFEQVKDRPLYLFDEAAERVEPASEPELATTASKAGAPRT
ncbi:MAG TPA: glycosyltransferase family 2 protein [Thermoleophilaceae bacterium]